MKNLKIGIGELSEKDRAERKAHTVKIKPKFKNMKIEINAEQPLGEVCKELERLGYKPYQPSVSNECAYTWSDGFYCLDKCMESKVIYQAVTLTELKAMEREND